MGYYTVLVANRGTPNAKLCHRSILPINQLIDTMCFRHQIVGDHDTITISIDGYILISIIFEEIWIDGYIYSQTTQNRCDF